MGKDLTRLVFILDRSGSMSGLERETIQGYNGMLKKQKDKPGKAFITTVLFDDKYELLHDCIDLQDIKPITENEYFVRGSTALLDSVGRTIKSIAHMCSTENEHVMFVIITDRMENASTEYDYKKVNDLISHQKELYNWEFIFLGANIDAAAVGKRFGIAKERVANFNADHEGTMLNYEVINAAVSRFREFGSVKQDWRARIDEDFEKRGNKKV